MALKNKNVELSVLEEGSSWVSETSISGAVSDGSTAELHSELRFHLVKHVHYALFGNGENHFLPLPILACSLICIVFGFACIKITPLIPQSHRPLYFLGYVCTITMCISTIHFGIVFCRRKQLTVVLLAAGTDALHKQRESQQHFMNVLNYMYAFSLLFAVFCMSWYVFLPSGFVANFSSYYGPALSVFYFIALLYMLIIYLVVASMWLWIVYVMYRTFNDRVLPSLTVDTLDNCEEVVITYTKALVRVSQDWKIYHILRALAGTFFGAYLVFLCKSETVQSSKFTDKHLRLIADFGIVGNALSAAGYFGGLWLSIFFAGFLNDFVNRTLMRQIGNMLLDVNMHYKNSLNRNKMSLAEAEKLLTNLMIILPHTNVGLEVGGVAIGVQKAITLGTIFAYLMSQLVSGVAS
jgi:hypothetical protein